MLSKVFCFRLETAGQVLGWLGVVGSSISTLVLSILLANSDMITRKFLENSLYTYFDAVHACFLLIGSIILALVLLNLVASVLLILGTVQNRHLMLLPWLTNSGIGLVFYGLYNLALLRVIAQSPPPQALFLFTVAAAFYALQVYIYYGIYSLYKQIQLSRDQELPLVNQQPQYVAVTRQQDKTLPVYTKM